jgi:hypothetical protein
MGTSYPYDIGAPRDDASVAVIRQATDAGTKHIGTTDAY